MSSHSFSTTGFILKRSDVGEMDRVVTVFTKEHGKVTAIAKGCRKLTSSRSSALEPGSLSKLYLVETKSLPILTQAQLINEFAEAKKELVRMRKLFEVLEIIDSLLQDGDAQEHVFSHVEQIFSLLVAKDLQNGLIRDHLSSIIEELGFVEKEKLDVTKPLRDFVEEITARKLHAYAYLTQG